MAVLQQNKKKVRLVVDYRRLNEFFSSHSAEANACGDKLKEWRGIGSNLAIVDLKSAYSNTCCLRFVEISSRQVPWPKLRSYSTGI